MFTFEPRYQIKKEYYPVDVDTMMLLEYFDEPVGSRVLEVGANEEYTSCVLADNGFNVLGIDLRDQAFPYLVPTNYFRLRGDFVEVAKHLESGSFDCAFSTSAIEHFGLRVYGQAFVKDDYDSETMDEVFRVLKPGGKCYLTIPFGAKYYQMGDWRMYSEDSLRRLVGKFKVVKQFYFKSGDAPGCPDVEGMVTEEDAKKWDEPTRPHITVFLVLQKSN